MYGLNVPVPNAVRRLARDLEPALAPFDYVRDRHSLLCKRFEGERDPGRIHERVADTLAGTEPFAVRVDGIGAFHDPPKGGTPVVYLAVESPGLRAVHERLVARFDAVPGLEGDGYTPHVTLARGLSDDGPLGIGHGSDPVGRLQSESFDPVTWTVDELGIWSREYDEFVSRVSLPP